MKDLLFTDNLAELKKKVDINRADASFIIFDDSSAGREIFDYLHGATSYIHIEATDFYREQSDHFRQTYIEFMARLNQDNASRDWWIHDFTSKNMLATNLGQNLFQAKIVSQLLTDKPAEGLLIVVAQDLDLKSLLKKLAVTEGSKFIDAARRRSTIKALTEFIPVYHFFYLFRTFYYVFMMRRLLKANICNKNLIVFATLINYQSFTETGDYHDTYFGELVDFTAKQGKNVMVLGKLLGDYRRNIYAIKSSKRQNILPMEYFLRPADIYKCFGRALLNFFRFVRIKGETNYEGIDVGYLIRRLMRKDNGRAYFFNLLFFYCAKALENRVDIQAFVYPFENRSFEKMFLLAFRETDSKAKTFGYNHASVTLKHTNLFLGKGESSVVPLPDQIVTLGRVSREILVDQGNMPTNKVNIGCGLRQKVIADPSIRSRRRPIKKILLVLTAEIAEYIKILSFINQAFPSGSGRYQVMIRPHPVTPLSRALEMIDLNFEFEEKSTEPLYEVLSIADIVLYTSSTVGIEAIAHGVPAVYLNFGDIILSDPMFGLDVFKWSISEPKDLPLVLEYVESLPDDQYERDRHQAIEYAQDYILPATKANLNRFLELITT